MFYFFNFFKGLSNATQLHVQGVNQISNFKINEIGLETSSLTFFGFLGISSTKIKNQISFNVDQPFMCYLYSKKLELPIMVAHVINPNKN